MATCRRGHVNPERYSNGNCKPCLIEREAAKRQNHKWRAEKLAREKERYWSDPNKKLNYDKKHRITYKERRKELYQNNPTLVIERNARRRCSAREATPKWAETKAIRFLYEQARDLGLTVDHIVPLISDRVCGLHCMSNLLLTTKSKNSAKGNRFWPHMFEESKCR